MSVISKFSKGYLGGCTVRGVRKPGSVEVAEVNSLAPHTYTSSVSSSVAASLDAFESVQVIPSEPAVQLILCGSRQAQITSSVVQCISDANVVHLNAISRCQSHYYAVHPFTSALSGAIDNISHRIKALSFRIPCRAPLPLRNKFVVGSIHDGYLPLRKRNSAIGFFRECHRNLLSGWRKPSALTLDTPILTSNSILEVFNHGYNCVY